VASKLMKAPRASVSAGPHEERAGLFRNCARAGHQHLMPQRDDPTSAPRPRRHEKLVVEAIDPRLHRPPPSFPTSRPFRGMAIFRREKTSAKPLLNSLMRKGVSCRAELGRHLPASSATICAACGGGTQYDFFAHHSGAGREAHSGLLENTLAQLQQAPAASCCAKILRKGLFVSVSGAEILEQVARDSRLFARPMVCRPVIVAP